MENKPGSVPQAGGNVSRFFQGLGFPPGRVEPEHLRDRKSGTFFFPFPPLPLTFKSAFACLLRASSRGLLEIVCFAKQ